jgi:hypothetical protein
MHSTLAVSTLVLALLAPSICLADDKSAAIEAANAWLALVDSGRHAESWDDAASLFRHALTREQWVQAVGAVRGPLGRVVSRSVRGAQYAESLPGAPDGRYVIIQYDVVYEHKRSAIETVTPMDDGGRWRVSGYFIK